MTESFEYGDIITVNFNPVKGAEISKIRPCVVVSHNLLNIHSSLLIAVPLTSNTKKVLPFHIIITKSKSNGLAENSKAIPEQIKSLDTVRCVKKIGTLEKHYLEILEEKIRFVLNQE